MSMFFSFVNETRVCLHCSIHRQSRSCWVFSKFIWIWRCFSFLGKRGCWFRWWLVVLIWGWLWMMIWGWLWLRIIVLIFGG